MLEFAILGFVCEKDMTGYDAKKAIEEGIGVCYKASFGSLYPALKRLVGKGCLTAYTQPQGARKKVFYSITPKGQTTFTQWLTSPIKLFEGTNACLTKVFFYDKLPRETRDRLLLAYELENTEYLQKLEALAETFRNLEHKEKFYYKLTTLYFGICATRQRIEWCRLIRAKLPLPGLTTREADA